MKLLFEVAHGSNVAGKCDPTGTFKEYIYSREIVSRIVHELKKRGYDATNLVPELYEPGLDERVRRVNEMCQTYGKENCLFFSVHVNASRNGKWGNARGWCCYTTPGTTKSDRLAEHLYMAAERCFPGHQIRRDKSDGDSDWEKRFYVLMHTLCPAVLTENFFMDNKEDLAYLCSDEGKDAIVRCHVEGVISYLEELANGKETTRR